LKKWIRGGNIKSIIQDEKKCYISESEYNLEEHHIFFGKNRKMSEKYGLKIWLTNKYHITSNVAVHNNIVLDNELKQMAQRKFEESHTRKEFMKIFGKNYL